MSFLMSIYFYNIASAADATYDNVTVNTRQSIGASILNNYRLYVSRPGSEYGAGYSNILAYRNGSGTANQGGTGWQYNYTDAAITGYSYWGNAYSAGIAAFSYLDFNNSAALVAAKNDGTGATYLAYKDPLSNGLVWSARFTNDIVMGPQIAGQRWIIHSNPRMFTIAPDLGTNFDWSKNLTINRNGGQVGIGVAPADNSSFRLAVEGKIGCRELVVTSLSWADYVFNPDYNLKPLADVEKFIKANKHLEGIPSETEVKNNGISVGEMQSKLLQKLEETTLYLIEMKKENEMLKEKVCAIEKIVNVK